MRLDPKFKDFQAKHKWDDEDLGKPIGSSIEGKFISNFYSFKTAKQEYLSYDDINKALEKLDKHEDMDTQAYSDAGASSL